MSVYPTASRSQFVQQKRTPQGVILMIWLVDIFLFEKNICSSSLEKKKASFFLSLTSSSSRTTFSSNLGTN